MCLHPPYCVATAQVLYIRTDTLKATPLRSVAYLTSTCSQVSGLLPLITAHAHHLPVLQASFCRSAPLSAPVLPSTGLYTERDRSGLFIVLM